MLDKEGTIHYIKMKHVQNYGNHKGDEEEEYAEPLSRENGRKL